MDTYQQHGRVGDTPIIGAGLYVDGKVGGAVATGRGEECVRACGSFLTVEMMRLGKTPQEACEIAVKRIIELNLLSSHNRDSYYQIGLCAINTKGETGAVSVRDGFEYALYKGEENKLYVSEFIIKESYPMEDL
jgi:N4-(beta-N-acetylglucosaminyl)-L-asparaginase